MNINSTSLNPFPDALPAGTTLRGGDFSLEGVLGQGGFGITYRATDNGLHRKAAVKEFFPEGSQRTGKDVLSSGHTDSEFEEARTRFLDEARTLAQFNHPNIVNVYTIFEENNTAYMVMEYIEGSALSSLVETRGALPPAEALPIIQQIGAALETVHSAGILHLDVKPDNVIVNEGGQTLRAVLLDFGLTRKLESATGYGTTRLDAFARFGTAGYAPPEQYSRTAQPHVYTDVYALAATSYFLLTGQVPPDSVDRASGSPLADPRTYNREVSSSSAAALTAGLALEPKARPQSVRTFLDLLNAPAAPPQSTSATSDENVLVTHRSSRQYQQDSDEEETADEFFDQLFGGQDPFSSRAPRRHSPRSQAPRPVQRPQHYNPRNDNPFGHMPFPGVRVSGCGCGPCCLSFVILLFFLVSFLGAIFSGF